MQNNIIYLIQPNLSDFNQILDVTERKISVFIACRTFNVIELRYGVTCVLPKFSWRSHS